METTLKAVVYLNGTQYRLSGVSHDAGGSRIRYDSVDAMDARIREHFGAADRLPDSEEAQATWTADHDGNHYKIEAHLHANLSPTSC